MKTLRICLSFIVIVTSIGDVRAQVLRAIVTSAPPAAAGSGPTVVQHVLCNNNPGTTTATCAFGSNATAGNLEILLVSNNCGAGTDVTTVAGSSGGSFTANNPGTTFNSNGTLCMNSWYKNSVAGGAETITVTWTSPGAVQTGIEILEITGQNASPFDNGGAACFANGSAASTSWATASCTVTAAHALLVALAWQGNNLVTTTAGSGFTSLDSIGAATTNGSGVAESKAVTASQTMTATSSNSTNAWQMVGFVIK